MILGNLNKANLLVIIFLFFGSVSVGFTMIGETHYAIMSIIIGAIIHFFNGAYQYQEDLEEEELSFAIELNSLSKMVTYGLAPSVLLVQITNQSVVSVMVAAFYLLAVATRIAHYNRPLELQGEVEESSVYGLPLVSIAMVLPLLSILTWIAPTTLVMYLWILAFGLCLVGFILKIELPRIPANFIFAILALGIFALGLLLIQGPIKF